MWQRSFILLLLLELFSVPAVAGFKKNRLISLKASVRELLTKTVDDGFIVWGGKEARIIDKQELSPAAQILHDYIQHKSSCSSGTTSIKNLDLDFYVQGWKWHTMSLIRDAKRLGTAAALLGSELWDLQSLHVACAHVIDFNMKGLQKIESQTFFPWVQQRLGGILVKQDQDMDDVNYNGKQMVRDLDSVMHQLECTQKDMRKLGSEIMSLSSPSKNPLSKKEKDIIWSKVAIKSAQLAEHAQIMFDTEQAVLIPLVALTIPARDQMDLNKIVLRRVGLWDSRLHLVGMHEAVCMDKREYAMFKKHIPNVMRRMIPRWKRLLYDPAMAPLDMVCAN